MLLHLRELQAASCGWSVGFERYMCIFPLLAPCITNSPTGGSVGPVSSQIHEQLTFKKVLLTHLQRYRAIFMDTFYWHILENRGSMPSTDALWSSHSGPSQTQIPQRKSSDSPGRCCWFLGEGLIYPLGVPGWFTRGQFLSFSVLSSVTGEWPCPPLLCFTDVSLSGTLATYFDIWKWKMLD